MKSQSEENPDFLHNAEQILGITAQRFFQPWIQPAMLFRLSKYSKPYYHSVNVLNKLLEKVNLCQTFAHQKFIHLIFISIFFSIYSCMSRKRLSTLKLWPRINYWKKI